MMCSTQMFFVLGCVCLVVALPIEPQSQSWISTVWEILERMINTESNVKRMGEEMKRSQDDVTSILEELKNVQVEIKRAQDNVTSGLEELKRRDAEIKSARDDVTSSLKEMQSSIENRFTTMKSELTHYITKTGNIIIHLKFTVLYLQALSLF